MFKKKDKELEPQWYISKTNKKVRNYKVYYLSFIEKFIAFIVGFVVGAAVGYLFYGGIGVDQYGEPTTLTYILNIVIPGTTGTALGLFFVPTFQKKQLDKQKKKLSNQFRDMLNALNTSLGAGKNVTDSFIAVREDLGIQYEEGAFILEELDVIISGMKNNIDIEELLMDLGERSGNVDILSFSKVFQISFRKGGNIKDVIRNTHSIISQKMAINDEIDVIVSANKQEQYIMVVLPIALVGLIKVSAPYLASNFVSGIGIGSTTAAIVIFAFSFWLAKELLDIKV